MKGRNDTHHRTGNLLGRRLRESFESDRIYPEVWLVVGTVLTSGIGMDYLKEPASVIKLASIGLNVFGIIGLQAGSRMPAAAGG